MCIECYIDKNRITPLLNPIECLQNHTQYSSIFVGLADSVFVLSVTLRVDCKDGISLSNH